MRCKYFFNDGGMTTCDNAIRGDEVDRMNCPYSVPEDCKYAEVERPPDATGKLISEFLADLEYIDDMSSEVIQELEDIKKKWEKRL